MVTKQTLRSVYLEKRKLLAHQEYGARNEKLCAQLISTFADRLTGRVHIFLPIESQREVDTWPVIRWLWERQIPVVTSRTLIKENRLQHLPLTPHTELKQSKWGIWEPTGGENIDPQSIDVVLVPLIAFDRAGQRIGYGKGFYDKFLAECRPDVVKIGLSLAPPLDQIEYTEHFDIPLDACITPLRVYTFGHGKI